MLQVSFGTPRAVVGAANLDTRVPGSVLFRRETAACAETNYQLLTIRLAQDDRERHEARDVVNRMYARRGYGSNHQIADRPHCVTFIAAGRDQTLGTLTLTIDSEQGLAADTTFPDELAGFRAQRGRSLCELTKFAFDPSPESRPLLATLFHVIYLYGMQHYACTDLLIEVNPRHVRFYEVMLGFKRVGPLRVNEAVDAPSQLMHLPVADIRTNIDLLRKQECYSGHSLYPMFLGPAEEAAVRRQVALTSRQKPARIGRTRDPLGVPLLPLIRNSRLFRTAIRKRAAA